AALRVELGQLGHDEGVQRLRPPLEPARASWVLELLLALPPGSVIKRHFGPTKRKQHTHYRLALHIPIASGWSSFAIALREALDEEGLGSAEIIGSSSRVDAQGRQTDETVTVEVRVRDDLEGGIRIIRDVLRRTQAPQGTTLTLTEPEHRPIPLQLDP
ncbi:MAG TPA: hypothetical protein VKD72_04450, partial [Gemmataceae bacterium]|nr:hypothetical protein [Gemmataceae bacterium]